MPPFYRYSLRDVAFIEKMAEELDKFCNELDVKTEEARAKGEYIRTAGRLGVEELPGVFTWQSRSK
jgi:hypothetical protein